MANVDLNQNSGRRISDTQNVMQIKREFNSFISKSERGDDGSNVAKLYDDWSNTYEQDVTKVEYKGPQQAGEYVSKYIADKNATILDLGAGSGLLADVLHPLGYRNLTALDISQKLLDIAKAKGFYSRLVCTEVGKEQMPFRENEFDALCCVGCLIPGHMNHTSFPDWIRVVKPGGFIFAVMRESYLEEKEFAGFFEAVKDLEDSKAWTRIARVPIPEYFDLHMGVGFVFKVL